ncbi:MAG: recombinase family protein [Acutalibacteraceae bacterium]
MSESRVYYYARVSTGEQNLDRQIEAFKELGANDKYIICDKASGKDIDRPNYQMLRNSLLRSGDTLVVKSLDRLSRRKADIKNELEYYKSIGVRVKIMDLPTTMVDIDGQEWIVEMVNNIIIEVLSSIAEQERKTTKQRQKEGIEAAHKKGKHLGRPKVIFPDNWQKNYDVWRSGQITATEAMQRMGLTRSSFYKLVKIYENK